ncbi:MAG TPA: glutamine-hydrolyzing GMP synthase, partial [Candidatus Lokiarchaeia archaeon]|nr:glutamine-hydrolyzing GMP synthase [Candidatus Lokiarchaeia archaeon]
MDTILVLDFGGQYCHLISRRVRDLGVYSEILPYNASLEKISDVQPKGIILSGGPASVYDEDAPTISRELVDFCTAAGIPLLGLCYGHHLLAQILGGQVTPHAKKEYGKTPLKVIKAEDVLAELQEEEVVWMSHGDQVESLPDGFEVYASTELCPVAAYGNNTMKIYGLQFHPEVRHTPSGDKILANFLFEICRCEKSWELTNLIPSLIQRIQDQVGEDGRVILGLSGGVDSSVAAMLLHRAIGDRLHCIFVNNGLLRKDEAEQVQQTFKDTLA